MPFIISTLPVVERLAIKTVLARRIADVRVADVAVAIPPIHLILGEELDRYRTAFEERHMQLASDMPDLDFTSEFQPIFINAQKFKTLFRDGNEGEYFVTHFICDDRQNGFRRLRPVFCRKQKKTPVDEIVSEVIDALGVPVTEAQFKQGKLNYLDRKLEIARRRNNSYAIDPQGRAHLIDAVSKDIVDSICREEQIIYGHFIVDIGGPDPGLSIAFSSYNLLKRDPGDEAYDHGSACCPL